MRKRHSSNDMFNESAMLNNATYLKYYKRLSELAISMFEWSNLPDEIDERFLEWCLYTYGSAVFFKDTELDKYLALQVTTEGQYNVYHIPINRRAYAINGYNKHLSIDDSVIIYNNVSRTNTELDIRDFARKLYLCERCIDVNLSAQRTPIMITCNDTQRLTMKNLYMQYDGNQPFIFGDKNLDLSSIKVLNTDAPYLCDKLTELKSNIYNEALTYLGITNVNYEKKERLISDEVVRSMGGTIAQRYTRLNTRRKAADEINKMFGLNIDVNYRSDYRELDDEFMLDNATGDNILASMVLDTRTNSPIKGMGSELTKEDLKGKE